MPLVYPMDFNAIPVSEEYTTRLLSYLGTRARDFSKCLDIHSTWCHKYAFIILQGLSGRNLDYTEEHHIVPMAYYRAVGLTCDRHNRQVCTHNLATLSLVEHTYAHFCMVKCCISHDMLGKFIRTFYLMFYGLREGTALYKRLYASGDIWAFNYISELDVLAELPDRSVKRLKQTRQPPQCNKPANTAYTKKRKYSYFRKYTRFPIPISEAVSSVIWQLHLILITPPATESIRDKILRSLPTRPIPKEPIVSRNTVVIVVPDIQPYVPKYTSHAKEPIVYDEPLVMLHGCNL